MQTPEPKDVDDVTITRKVESALLQDIETGSGQVVVKVSDGVVQLRGEVGTLRVSDELEARADAVADVRRVENLLHLRGADSSEFPATAPASGFPEEPAADQPGDRSNDPSPHHALNNPLGEPDPTEWPDPYERREDPRDAGDAVGVRPPGEAPHAVTGATSTSQPHPSQDPEAEPTEGPKRDRIDD